MRCSAPITWGHSIQQKYSQMQMAEIHNSTLQRLQNLYNILKGLNLSNIIKISIGTSDRPVIEPSAAPVHFNNFQETLVEMLSPAECPAKVAVLPVPDLG